MAEARPVIREALATDAPAVASYLAPRLRAREGERLFRRLLEYDWLDDKPNLGILIDNGGEVGGFIGAIYSRRRVRGRERLFCNIHSWHVEERFRKLSLPILERLLRVPDCTFTCFTPSDRTVAMFEFFKFQRLDAAKVIFAPVSGLPGLLNRRARIFRGGDLAARLTDDERRIVSDHRSYRCGSFVLEWDGRRSFFVTLRRGRRVRAFADVVHASDPEVLAECIAHAHLPIGMAHGTFLIGMDRRLLQRWPRGSFVYGGLRPPMFRSDSVGPEDIDVLYSELVPTYG